MRKIIYQKIFIFLLGFLSYLNAQSQVSTTDIYGSYNCDEGTGTTLNSQAIGNKNGTISNPSWQLGISGSALRLERSPVANVAGTSAVSLPAGSATTDLGSNAGTFSAWIKTNDLSSNAFSVIFYGNNQNTGNGRGADRELHLHLNNTTNGNIKTLAGYARLGSSGASGANANLTTVKAVNDNKWHHVLYTWFNDGTTQSLEIFLDGLSVGKYNSALVQSSAKFNARIFLGRTTQDATFGYTGLLDEIHIYKRVLNTQEIASLALVPPPVFAASASINFGLYSNSNNSIKLTWPKASDRQETIYELYASVNGGTENLITTLTDTTFTPTGLVRGAEYTFKVRAGNGNGDFGNSLSASITAEADEMPPSWSDSTRIAVTQITDTSLQVNSTLAVDNRSSVTYGLYQDGQLIASQADRLFNVTGLNPGTTYNFKIEATDLAGNWSTNGPSITATTFTTTALAERVDFPSFFHMANVKDYGAKGDGITDDTDAIQRAIQDRLFIRQLYFPAGTYIISKKLVSLNNRIEPQAWLQLYGQGKNHTRIKLVGNAADFQNASAPQPMIEFRGARESNGLEQPNVSFYNSIYDMTIDVGTGNPGAVGVDWVTCNGGSLRHVNFVSSDPGKIGYAGVRMSRNDGTSFMNDVTITGFSYGWYRAANAQSLAVDGLTLKDQLIAGIYNSNSVIAIHNLVSDNSVPTLLQVTGIAQASIINARITGGAPAPFVQTVKECMLYLRDIKATGSAALVKSDNGLLVPSLPSGTTLTGEWFSHPAAGGGALGSLKLPIKQAPEFHGEDFTKWAYVETASNDADWSKRLQAAIDSGAETIVMAGGQNRYQSPVIVRGNVKRIIGFWMQSSKNDTTASMSPTLSGLTEAQVYSSRFFMTIENTTADKVIIEQFHLFPGGILNNSSKTLVLKDMPIHAYANTPNATGDLFMESCQGTQYQIRHGQNAWIRSTDCVFGSATPDFLIDNSKVWILSNRTEAGGVFVRAQNNASVEIISTSQFIGSKGIGDNLAYETINSDFSLVNFSDLGFQSQGKYANLVKDSSATSTIIINRSSPGVFPRNALRSMSLYRTLDNVAVSSVDVSPIIDTVYTGTTKQLIANVLPDNATNKAVVWASTNSTIAIVDTTGLVTGILPGTVTVSATTVDGNFVGNATVIVKDTIPPTMRVRNIVIELDAVGEALITTAQIDSGSTDNIAINSYSLSKTNFSCTNLGDNTVVLTVTDSSGNSSSANAIITVLDKQKPNVVTKNISVTLVNGSALITTADVDNGSTDNCRISSLALSKSTFNCSDIGSNIVELTVIDSSGNSSSANATVTVEGQIPNAAIAVSRADNTFTGLSEQTIALGYGAQSLMLTATNLNSPTNIGVYNWSPAIGLSSTTVANPLFSPTQPGDYTFTVTVTNANGCSASSSIVIKVIDVRCGNKVLVCHKTGNGESQLCINKNSVQAHLSHGDKLGPCNNNISTLASNSMKSSAEIEELSNNYLLVYPNPLAKQTTLQYKLLADATQITIELYDIKGVKIKQLYSGPAKGGETKEFLFDASQLSSGTYFFRLTSPNEVLNFKTVVQ